MGKNRKARQVVNQAHAESAPENDDLDQVPVEFLTSDDFQVVHRKRHHSFKRSSDDSDEKLSLSRARSFSECLTDSDADKNGCHSSFWATRSTENVKELIGNVSTKELESYQGLNGDLREIKKDSFNCDINGDVGESVLQLKNNKNGVAVFDGQLLGQKCDGDLDIEGEVNGKSESVVKVPKEKLEQVPGVEEGDGVHRNRKSTTTESEVDTDDVQKDEHGKSVDKKAAQKKKNQKKKRKNHSKNNEESVVNESSSIQARMLVSSSSSDFSEVSSSCHNEPEGQKKTEETNSVGDRKRPSKKQLAAIHEALKKAKEEEEKRRIEEENRRRQAEEAERLQQERLRLEQEKKEKKKLREKQKKEKLKAEGKLLSKSQKQARARMLATLEALRQQGVDVPQIGEKRPLAPRLGSYRSLNRKRFDSSQSDAGLSERHKSESLSSQESSDLPSSLDSKDSWDIHAVEAALKKESCNCSDDKLSKNVIALKLKHSLDTVKLAKFKTDQLSSPEEKKESVKLRSPVICVLGHVDTGKTKLLDYIRKTHVQDSEAGGITQQIGATMIPQNALKEKCKMVKNFSSLPLKVPGLLVIDTPGHASFSNLRGRGTSVCDIAILVVDLMHGLEPQTLESINLLKTSKTPFVVALNKIDRLYGWKSSKEDDIENIIGQQSPSTALEFKKRCQEIILQFANECLNATLFYENIDPKSFVSMVPISAITGDGIGNLMHLITQLTQSRMHKKLVFSEELSCTVLEVKVISGLGTTIDVILVNGRLQEGDTIVLAGHEGPVVTQIRSLLMPQPLKEMRVKNPYIEYKTIEAAQGIKITGKDLDKAIAGLPLFVARNQNEIERFKTEVSDLLNQSMNYIKTSERGVYVQASTLGSLEALLGYLTSSDIPYFSVKIGPVVKKDVMKASVMLEHDKQYATILAFDVKVERDAQELADSLGVTIFRANIIYHLHDQFVEYRLKLLQKREEDKHMAVFPCILKVSPNQVPGKDTIAVTVESGTLKIGTPLCVPKGSVDLGIVSSIEVDHRSVTCANEGEDAHVKLETNLCDLPELPDGCVVSRITKQSIDVCKEHYKDEMHPSDWHLMTVLKKMLEIH